MFVESYPNGNHITSATWHVSNHNSLTSNIIKPFSLHLHTVQAKAKQRKKERARKVRSLVIVMATSVMASVSLKPTPFTVGNTAAKGLPSLGRKKASFAVVASGGKKIKTDKPFGIGGGMDLREGLDASGRKGKGKGVYQFVDKYGANVDGYSPIYNEEEWSPTGDVYTGGPVGLAIWAVTLLGLLAGGALLVYNTSALSQ